MKILVNLINIQRAMANSIDQHKLEAYIQVLTDTHGPEIILLLSSMYRRSIGAIRIAAAGRINQENIKVCYLAELATANQENENLDHATVPLMARLWRADMIHIPLADNVNNLGLKADACPGKLVTADHFFSTRNDGPEKGQLDITRDCRFDGIVLPKQTKTALVEQVLRQHTATIIPAPKNGQSLSHALLAHGQVEHKARRHKLQTANAASFKPVLAYVSPLPPEKTGIADYGKELIESLNRYYQIIAITDQPELEEEVLQHISSHQSIDWLLANPGKVDRVLYHIGNSPYHAYMISAILKVPGVAVAHDLFLGNLFEWLEHQRGLKLWRETLLNEEGIGALGLKNLNPHEAIVKYPCIWTLLNNSISTIVHSHYTKRLILERYPHIDAASVEVVAHLRRPVDQPLKQASRNELGMASTDLIVISLGGIGHNKLNHRLIECWEQSSLAGNRHAKLYLVGDDSDRDYRKLLDTLLAKSKRPTAIRIVGLVTTDQFQKYLASADIAVQLRANSRGETSGTILDCMNHGVATIINRHGANVEIEPSTAWFIDDQFSDSELIDALNNLAFNKQTREELGMQARETIQQRHQPEQCAEQYWRHIETCYRQAPIQPLACIQQVIQICKSSIGETDPTAWAQALAKTIPEQKPRRHLYLDITATSSTHLKTGIERVSNNILKQLLDSNFGDFQVEPVYLDCSSNQWLYRSAYLYTAQLMGFSADDIHDHAVSPSGGDVILCIDLSGPKFIEAHRSGYFEALREQGINIYSMVHDLLPIQMPHVFPEGTDGMHAEWLDKILLGDGALCVSQAVANDLSEVIARKTRGQSKSRPFAVAWSHHGSDVNTNQNQQLSSQDNMKLKQATQRPSILMVGTIEPRKAYLEVLQAFSQLWIEKVDINLVIIGREGWTSQPQAQRRDIPQTVNLLNNHPELNKRLYWFDNADDALLQMAYQSTSCLLMASYGEGFGLPIVEAMREGLPIIARDIPVFREIGADQASYFQGGHWWTIADAVRQWRYQFDEQAQRQSHQTLSWQESTANLSKIIDTAIKHRPITGEHHYGLSYS